jgi:hypothetical protein
MHEPAERIACPAVAQAGVEPQEDAVQATGVESPQAAQRCGGIILKPAPVVVRRRQHGQGAARHG